MILHQLYDDPDVVGVVLDRDDSHDVGGVLCVGVLAVLVGQHQARVCFMYLHDTTVTTSCWRALVIKMVGMKL